MYKLFGIPNCDNDIFLIRDILDGDEYELDRKVLLIAQEIIEKEIEEDQALSDEISSKMNIFSSYMDETIREEMHSELAGVTPRHFLLEYLESERDPGFNAVMRSEFPHIYYYVFVK